MMDDNVKKVFQKRLYDLLSHKYGILTILIGLFLLGISAFHFGEAWFEWSKEKYEVVFHSFSDNIAGKSFRERLTLPVPIDVVYTWVNGTDPDTMMQLEQIRLLTEKQSNITSDICSYTNCLPVGVVVNPALPDTISLKDLHSMGNGSSFGNVSSLIQVKQQPNITANITLLIQEQNVSTIVHRFEKGWTFQGRNYTLRKAFYTSDTQLTHGLLMPLMVMVTGFPAQGYTEEKLQSSIATHLGVDEKTSDLDLTVHWDKGVALFQASDKKQFEAAIGDKNFTLEGKILRLAAVTLVWDLHATTPDTEVAAYRFQDKEELRYSLRSVEKFAPWVRHIFIVTNGQIPYWLNMDNPRLTVVTHKEIFANASHLPTFSSPAIEANLHRIPGLADKFLYLNDDVMFGAPVWPDDFFSHSTGHKVYLSWPVPNCNDGCPSTWINDGYCDKACNSSECDWDGGDCIGSPEKQVQLGAGFHGGQADYLTSDSAFCSGGCANSWLADKYCDQSCNSFLCGFDCGDCGVDNYNQLHGQNLSLTNTHYDLAPGETVAYFNLTSLLGKEGRVASAKFASDPAVRTAAVSNKYKVLTLIMLKGHNKTKVTFEMEYTRDNITSKMNFTVSADTNRTVVPSVIAGEVNGTTTNNTSIRPKTEEELQDEMDAVAFVGFDNGPRQASAVTVTPLIQDSALGSMELEMDVLTYHKSLNLSDDLENELVAVEKLKAQGYLTELGLKRKLHTIYSLFKSDLANIAWKLNLVKSRNVTHKENVDSKDKRDISINSKKKEETEVNASVAMNEKDNKTSTKVGKIEPERKSNFDAVKDNSHSAIEKKVDKAYNDKEKVPLVDHSDPDGKNENIKSVNILVDENEESPLKMKKFDSKNRTKESVGNAGMEDGKGEEGLKVRGPGRKLLALIPFASSYWKNKFQMAQEKRAQRNREMRARKIADEEYLQLVDVEHAGDAVHPMPWEERLEGILTENETEVEQVQKDKTNPYYVEGWQSRHLLDAFGDSLRHVNQLYNKEFGFASRKAMAHMPHMIDKNIMTELQARFPQQWEATSSHQIRHPKDMQFAFAYYYYVMGVTQSISSSQVFDMMDTDDSGVLSDREIRTLAAKLYDLPLYLEILTGLELMFINCSQREANVTLPSPTVELEMYYDKNMPQVTKHLFQNCDPIVELVKKRFISNPKYKTTIMDDLDVAFKIIHSNVSKVVGQLDDIRKHPKKFICLNDNMDHSIDEAKTVTAVLQDYYESVLPKPSQFELARDYRNRFLHMDELREWRAYRDWLQFWTHVALGVLIIFTIISFLGDKIESMSRRITRRFGQRSPSSSSVSSTSSSPSISPSSSPDPFKSDEASGFLESVETV